MLTCSRCNKEIEAGEEREWHGQTLCEDCCIDVMSPAKACDPWAVYSAKSFSHKDGPKIELTQRQSKLIQVLKETGGGEMNVIAERLQIKVSDLEREIATLRHMEMVRGELREGKKIIRLW